MKIYTLWGKRGDGTIELMVAWDEYCVEGNPEGFKEALVDARKQARMLRKMSEVEIE